MHAWVRMLQRYAVPRLLASLIFYFRDGVKISASTRVQLTRKICFRRDSVVNPYSIVQTSGGSITFGSHCAISSSNHISAGQADIIAGEYVRTGPNVTIVATTRNYRDKSRPVVEQGYADRGITIGNDVLIGVGAVLVDVCNIGDGAIIAVGSLVTGHVAPYSVVFGSLAKVILWRQ